MLFAIPSIAERRAKVTPRLNNLSALHVMAYTGIKHNKLWFFIIMHQPSEDTRNQMARYFVQKEGDAFVYCLDNSHALEVWG